MAYPEDVQKLINTAASLYASKDYSAAADKYAEACEKAAAASGSEDADLLFLYGKALFQCAVANSQVLGGVTGGDEKPDDEEAPTEKDSRFQFSEEVPLAEEDDVSEDEGPQKAEESDSEDDQDENEAEEEEQTDFEVAWEILDLTRTLFEAQLAEFDEKDDVKKTEPLLQSESEEPSDPQTLIRKKLADVYDILGEVSLEAENFQQAATDLESSLKLRELLYPIGNGLLSESHYKLSLAFEFCVEDPESTAKAIKQMELAIASMRAAASGVDTDLLQDMKVRLADLKKDPEEKMKEEKDRIIEGILGQAAPTAAPKEAPAPAAVNDLTSMVKKRKPSAGKLVNGKRAKK
ncbi:unnamed protein product [Kuraishia capsulata CBS 1993]|uniref:Tetratricopeptide SHNi-TPR domain-containing protein n=1 Tax=Kuraishia capsulata CBS 1993 TaxID=1382522 RepID=W6MI74_9ASCO|nr:uncharacterized protein KUCA_T00001801001 [Kuraishia capsulata CBS 1993]CDK25831.1 unnamed protein product [Kuraishia capsulata CBS 1993]